MHQLTKLNMKFHVKINCKQYGTPQCAHLLNVPALCFCIWSHDGSNGPKYFAKFLVLITNIGCVID